MLERLFLLDICSPLVWEQGFLRDQPWGFNKPFFQSLSIFDIGDVSSLSQRENSEETLFVCLFICLKYFCPSVSPCVPYVLPTAPVSACPVKHLCAAGLQRNTNNI